MLAFSYYKCSGLLGSSAHCGRLQAEACWFPPRGHPERSLGGAGSHRHIQSCLNSGLGLCFLPSLCSTQCRLWVHLLHCRQSRFLGPTLSPLLSVFPELVHLFFFHILFPLGEGAGVTTHVWKSEDNLQKSVLPFHHVGPSRRVSHGAAQQLHSVCNYASRPPLSPPC